MLSVPGFVLDLVSVGRMT